MANIGAAAGVPRVGAHGGLYLPLDPGAWAATPQKVAALRRDIGCKCTAQGEYAAIVSSQGFNCRPFLNMKEGPLMPSRRPALNPAAHEEGERARR